jgi:protein-disulfide isomerase
MTEQRSLKPFYLAMAALAIAGAVLIGRAVSQRGASPPSLAAPLPMSLGAAAGPRGVALGSESAPLEIAEYSDFQCPFCARFAVLQLPDIKQRLVETGRLRWRFMHFPLDNHRNSPAAHLAAACAGEQGRFWPMHDMLYMAQDEWAASRRPERQFREYARRLDLDDSRYESCVTEQRPWPQVLADRRFGDSLGVNSTPTFFVNGRPLATVPSFDEIRAIVDSLAPSATEAGGTGTSRR